MWISLCILWNLWISCGKFAIFNLKSIKISQFLNLFLNFSTILCHSRIQMGRGVSSQNYQFRSILNSKFVINYTNICNICSEILSCFADFFQYFVRFHSRYCEIHGFLVNPWNLYICLICNCLYILCCEPNN